MNAWPFVFAAYALMLLGCAALTFWAWRAMRVAERFADKVTRR